MQGFLKGRELEILVTGFNLLVDSNLIINLNLQKNICSLMKKGGYC